MRNKSLIVFFKNFAEFVKYRIGLLFNWNAARDFLFFWIFDWVIWYTKRLAKQIYKPMFKLWWLLPKMMHWFIVFFYKLESWITAYAAQNMTSKMIYVNHRDDRFKMRASGRVTLIFFCQWNEIFWINEMKTRFASKCLNDHFFGFFDILKNFIFYEIFSLWKAQ